MLTRTAIGLLLFVTILSPAFQASAGGRASVRIKTSDNPVVDVPWNATITVLQHDVTPVDIEPIVALFINSVSGEEVSVSGVHTGETGTYNLNVTFPASGLWNWTVTPGGFPPFNMVSLTVGEHAEQISQDHVEVILAGGSCLAQTGEIGRYAVSWLRTADSEPVGVLTVARFDRAIAGSSATTWAIIVAGTDATTQFKACIDVPSFDLSQPFVVTNSPVDAENARLTFTAVPVNGGTQGSLIINPPSIDEVVVGIESDGGGLFVPGTITVSAGTTVTWVNNSDIAHTISGMDPTFKSSGMIDPGQQFSQTFTTPGTFSYRCDPHGRMSGVIEVVES